jgi:hypothetical protein
MSAKHNEALSDHGERFLFVPNHGKNRIFQRPS